MTSPIPDDLKQLAALAESGSIDRLAEAARTAVPALIARVAEVEAENKSYRWRDDGSAPHIAALHEWQHSGVKLLVKPIGGGNIIEWAAQELAAYAADLARVTAERDEAARKVWLLTNGQEGTWRCFQCDQVFMSRKEAERHFGHFPGDKPLCRHEHAGDETYWRDRYNSLEARHYQMRDAEFKRWKGVCSERDAAIAERDALLAASAAPEADFAEVGKPIPPKMWASMLEKEAAAPEAPREPSEGAIEAAIYTFNDTRLDEPRKSLTEVFRDTLRKAYAVDFPPKTETR